MYIMCTGVCVLERVYDMYITMHGYVLYITAHMKQVPVCVYYIILYGS